MQGLAEGFPASGIAAAIIAAPYYSANRADTNENFQSLPEKGIWGCLNDDNTLWWGARNGLTFGRFDANNPQAVGPKLETGKFHLVAGRMGAGGGTVKLELFVNSAKPVATADFPVNPKANPSRMSIGQERDASQHPGHESFDGEIARFLIWERPLTDAELAASMELLRGTYLAGRSSKSHWGSLRRATPAQAGSASRSWP